MKHPALLLLVTLAASHPVAAATKPIKVFILASQSNMESAGQIKFNAEYETRYLIGAAMGAAMG